MVVDTLFQAVETLLLMLSSTAEIADFMPFQMPDTVPEIAVSTVSMTVLIPFQMVSNVLLMPSRSGERNETMPFQIAEIFS